MKLWRFIVPLILALSITVPVAASDVSSAVYTGDIVVTNSAGSTQAGSVAFTLNTDNLLSAGYIAPDFSNVAVQTPTLTDAAFMPARSGSDQWLIYVPSILSTQTYRLYTGGTTDMDAKLRYFPGDQGMTVADAASLELGNSFNVEWAGYVPTTGTLNSKDDAFVLETIDSTLSASILDATATVGNTSNQDSTPMLYATANTRIGSRFNGTGIAKLITGAQIYLKIKGSPTGTAYLKVYNADTGANIATLGSIDVATLTDTFSLKTFADQAIIIPGDIDAYVVMEYTEGDASNGVYAGSTTMPSGTIPITRYADGAWTDYANAPCVKLSYNPVLARVTHSIIPGDHVIAVTADGNNMTLSIDSTTVDTTSLAAVSVPDNGSSWISCINTPYMDYLKITVGGVLRQHIAWENAATFTDISGNGNHATPTFRDSTSDPDLSAEFRNYRPVAVAAPVIPESGAPVLITATPVAPANMYTDDDYDNIPGAAAFNAMLDDADIPREFIWYPGIFLLAIAAGFIIYLLTRSLIALSVAMTLVILAFTFLGPLPFWLIIPFALFSFATIVKRENPGGL